MTSNTGENRGRFTKGDPRINRRGRPETFDAAQRLAQQIAHETAKRGDGSKVIIEGHVATVMEMIFRQWASSKNPQLQRAFVEYAFGKPPERSEITGADGGAVVLRVIYDNKDSKPNV